MPVSPERTDAWCCEPTYYGTDCERPADYEVIYGCGPDETTLLCEQCLKETWQPYWQACPLSEEQRQAYSVSWADWISVGGERRIDH